MFAQQQLIAQLEPTAIANRNSVLQFWQRTNHVQKHLQCLKVVDFQLFASTQNAPLFSASQ